MKILKNHAIKPIILCVMLTLLFSVCSLFVCDFGVVKADNPSYSVTFKKGDTILKSMSVEEGGYITEGDLPNQQTHPNELPPLKNEYYRWFYSLNNGQTFIRITESGDSAAQVIKNINCDVILWVREFPNTSSYHKVTFVLPDATKVTKTVEDGGTVDEPIVDLGFCERAKYDKSLANIQEDMTINVSIDSTYKYIFVAGCLTALITSIVVIVVIIFKTLKVPDDDDDDEDEMVADEVN